MGHTAGIHTRSRDVARVYGTEMPASRVIVNSPTTHGAIGFSTALPPSMTLGCGSWGGNVTSDNISPWHLMDIKRVAFETRPVASKRPAARSADAQAQGRREQTAAPSSRPLAASPSAGGVSREEIAQIVDRFLSTRPTPTPASSTGATLHAADSPAPVQANIDIEPQRVSPSGGAAPQPEAAPNVQGSNGGGNGSYSNASTAAPASATAKPPASNMSAQPNATANGQSTTAANGHRAVDFVCEDDVRRAIQKGEKIYVGARTIITPAARDMGDASEVFAKG
jgi:hypothetical protein